MNPEDLFPHGHELRTDQGVITGDATVGSRRVCVIGTTGGVHIDSAAALRLAEHVLDCVEEAPRRPIVMLVDTAGQAPRRHDELLGMPVFFGHLLACLEVARRRGHRLLALATGKAIAGAFLSYGMFADDTFALSGSEVGLMPIEAMAEVTKIPVERLTELSRTMPALEFWCRRVRPPRRHRRGVAAGRSRRSPCRRTRGAARLCCRRPAGPRRGPAGRPASGRRGPGPGRAGRCWGRGRSRCWSRVVTGILDRHWLAWPAGPPAPLSGDAGALAAWHAAGHPFVVCRNVTGDPSRSVLGCSLPRPEAKPARANGWVSADALVAAAQPPEIADVAEAAPRAYQRPLRELAGCAGAPRVYGSFAWHYLTGTSYVSSESDIDLLWAARTRRDVAAIGERLARWEQRHGLRADGEIVGAHGAVAWREAAAAVWAGAGHVLVKHLHALELVDHRTQWP